MYRPSVYRTLHDKICLEMAHPRLMGGNLTSTCKYAQAFTKSLQKIAFCLESSLKLLVISMFCIFSKILTFLMKSFRKVVFGHENCA